MKKLFLIIGLAAIASVSSAAYKDANGDPIEYSKPDPIKYAQNDTSGVPTISEASASSDSKIAEKAAVDFAKGATNVSNWSASPYATYFPNKVHAASFGGGLFVTYAVKGSENVAVGIGIDYLGRATIANGNCTLKIPVDVGGYIGQPKGKLMAVPFALGGLSTPFGGAGGDNGGIGVIAGGGAMVPIGGGFKLLGKQIKSTLGVAALKYTNVGIYSGMHYHIFATFSW